MTNLHLHTQYSMLDGLIKPKQLMQKIKDLNQSAVAITDHGSVAGLVEFWKEARKSNIKPILGCEFYHERGQTNHHLILLAKNLEGYRNLITLNNLAQANFYKKARINDDMLKKYGNGLICLTACIQGYLPQTILNGCPDWQWVLALRVWCDDVYLEVQNHGIPDPRRTLPAHQASSGARDFVLNLITQALDEADAENATEQNTPTEAPVAPRVADVTAPAGTDIPHEDNAV